MEKLEFEKLALLRKNLAEDFRVNEQMAEMHDCDEYGNQSSLISELYVQKHLCLAELSRKYLKYIDANFPELKKTDRPANR